MGAKKSKSQEVKSSLIEPEHLPISFEGQSHFVEGLLDYLPYPVQLLFVSSEPLGYVGADRPHTPVSRLFDKKVRPVAQVRVREGVAAVEVEHASVRAAVEATAEGDQASACILIIIIRHIGG